MPPSSFDLGAPPRRRRPSLTPMIDVVFLLLVFFMLAARFGVDNAIPLGPAVQGSGSYSGAPRLISVSPAGVLLNGTATPLEALPDRLLQLMPSDDAIVVVRPVDGADLQAVVNVVDSLSGAGISRIVLVE